MKQRFSREEQEKPITVYGVAVTARQPFLSAGYHMELRECNAAGGQDTWESIPLNAPGKTNTFRYVYYNYNYLWFLDSLVPIQLDVPSFEFYFDTPHQIGRSFDLAFFQENHHDYGEDYEDSVIKCVAINIAIFGPDDTVGEYPRDWTMEAGNHDNPAPVTDFSPLWGGAFPIVKLRCSTPLCGVYRVAGDGDRVTFAWPDLGAEAYELALSRGGQSDSEAVTVGTVDTFYTFAGMSPGVPYTLHLRKGCRYTTGGYDTVVWSGWSVPQQYFHTGIAEVDAGMVEVFPNPACGEVHVSSSLELQGVEAYDVRGCKVLERRLAGTAAVLDAGTLPAGSYVLRFFTPGGVATKRLQVR